MGLEAATYVADLVSTNPLGSDGKAQGDDHLRLLKAVLQNTFPNATGAYAFTTDLVTITSTDAGAGALPIIDLYRNSASPIANDALAVLQWSGKDSGTAKQVYGQLYFDIQDPTAGSEDASFYVNIVVAGTVERIVGGRFDFFGLGPNSREGYSIGRNDNDGYFELQGGNDAAGGKFRAYSSGHATQARDVEYYSNNTLIYIYDFSGGFHEFINSVYLPNALFLGQITTIQPGAGNNTQGGAFDYTVGGLRVNANGSSHSIGRCQDGGIVSWTALGVTRGSVSIAGPTTTYNTTSDKRQKTDWVKFDSGEILDKLEVWNFAWKETKQRAYGVLAQDAFEVFPDAITYDKNIDFWGVDNSKFVPLLINEVQSLRRRVDVLESSR